MVVRRRPRKAERAVKLSVTVPPQLVRLAEERVATGDAPSISALVTRALEHELLFRKESATGRDAARAEPLEDDELSLLIKSWIDSGEMVVTEEHREWSRRVLDL